VARRLHADVIAGLVAALVEVKTWNGTFQRARAIYCAKGQQDTYYELLLESTHPVMLEFTKEGGHNEASLLYWVGSNCLQMKPPPELLCKVDKMRVAAQISDADALRMRDAMRGACATTRYEMEVMRP